MAGYFNKRTVIELLRKLQTMDKTDIIEVNVDWLHSLALWAYKALKNEEITTDATPSRELD